MHFVSIDGFSFNLFPSLWGTTGNSTLGYLSGAPTLTVCEREGRNEMEEQEANDQNKSPEPPRDYKLPEACKLLDEQMKDSDWLET